MQENGSEKNDIPTHIRFRYILIGSLDILIGADSFVDVDNWRDVLWFDFNWIFMIYDWTSCGTAGGEKCKGHHLNI